MVNYKRHARLKNFNIGRLYNLRFIDMGLIICFGLIPPVILQYLQQLPLLIISRQIVSFWFEPLI